MDSIFTQFEKCQPLLRGWSDDEKFIVETVKGERCLLRLSDIAVYDRKRAEYDMVQRVHGLGVITPKPLDFGLCNNGEKVYQLFSWLDGKDAAAVLPSLPENQQYDLGLKAGAALQKMHTFIGFGLRCKAR